MIQKLRQYNKKRRYALEVRRTRFLVGPGDRVRVVRGAGAQVGTVLNVRAYIHGQKEVYIQGDWNAFAGWFMIEAILPLGEGPV